MRIVDIRETAIPLKSDLKNSSFDFSEMTTSVVAVITDVVRDGAPVVGFAFNSTGRYACGAQMRARFIPRILAADPRGAARRQRGRTSIRRKSSPCMLQREKSGGHSERSIAIGTIEVAVWDAVAKIAGQAAASRARRALQRRPGRRARCSATSAAAGIGRARPSPTCRTRCAAISMPATPWSR